MNQTKFLLPESEIPTHWYNVVADMPNKPAPVLGPDGQPISPDALSAIFVDSLIEQEVSAERWIPIPEPVREIYRLWRPAPLFRAHRLEAELGTPARIYYKYEGVSPAGSHKLNSAIAQAYYNREAGIRRMTTETGAGQWGCSLALAGQMFGIDIRVFMVKVSYQQKPFRRSMMQTWGAEVLASPSPLTAAGRAALEADDNNPGSLGLAIAEAVEEAASRSDTTYGLGSVLNHVLLHQSVIGLEAMQQMEMADAWPDVVLSCTGGGSNFAGIAFPFLGSGLRGERPMPRIVGVEPSACPSLTRGKYAYDYGDTAQMTPITKMHTLGSSFTPPGFHAGGLRYHGMAPLVSHVKELGLMEAVAYGQGECFAAGVLFARHEGIVPAPESTHAIQGAIQEALRCKREGKEDTILFCLSGHGHFDMAAYTRYLAGELKDDVCDETELARALEALPQITE